jgi:hypothetical protein
MLNIYGATLSANADATTNADARRNLCVPVEPPGSSASPSRRPAGDVPDIASPAPEPVSLLGVAGASKIEAVDRVCVNVVVVVATAAFDGVGIR